MRPASPHQQVGGWLQGKAGLRAPISTAGRAADGFLSPSEDKTPTCLFSSFFKFLVCREDSASSAFAFCQMPKVRKQTPVANRGKHDFYSLFPSTNQTGDS